MALAMVYSPSKRFKLVHRRALKMEQLGLVVGQHWRNMLIKHPGNIDLSEARNRMSLRPSPFDALLNSPFGHERENQDAIQELKSSQYVLLVTDKRDAAFYRCPFSKDDNGNWQVVPSSLYPQQDAEMNSLLRMVQTNAQFMGKQLPKSEPSKQAAVSEELHRKAEALMQSGAGEFKPISVDADKASRLASGGSSALSNGAVGAGAGALAVAGAGVAMAGTKSEAKTAAENKTPNDQAASSDKDTKDEEPKKWIELDIRDEHNKAFSGVSITLIDQAGNEYVHTLGDGPLLIEDLQSEGTLQLRVDPEAWLPIAESRKPFPKDQDSPLPAYVSGGLGHQGSTKQHLKITSGDMISTELENPLPIRHQAGKADYKSGLTPGNSYVLEVRGFAYETLRVGVFFDGTGNNSYNSEAGKAAIQEWIDQCENESEKESLKNALNSCNQGEAPVGGSYANDITNVGKLFELYHDTTSCSDLVAKVYVDGIGTIQGDGDALGTQALSVGETSIEGNVERALEKLIPESIQYNTDRYGVLDKVTAIEFDVFGFSRGAAAARMFARCVAEGEVKALQEKLNELGIPLVNDFDWQSKEYVKNKFVGVFDTVEAAPNMPDWKIGVHSDMVERLVHLCAADEYRFFFPLTRVSDDSIGETIPGNFTELLLPGCHSDIGGGYYSRTSLRGDADPKLVECKELDSQGGTYHSSTGNPKESPWYHLIKKHAERLLEEGWVDEVYEDMKPGELPKKNAASICVMHNQEYKDNTGVAKALNLSVYNTEVKLFINRVVEGDYSRIPLKVMYEAALSDNVPLHDWNPNHSKYTLKLLDSGVQNLVGSWVASAKESGVSLNLSKRFNRNTYKYLRRSFLHISNDCSIANKIDGSGFNPERRLHANPYESSQVVRFLTPNYK